METTLIAYVSKTGTTREIALEIEKILREAGADARALPVSQVTSLSEYSRVVVGAPINGMRWVPEAVAFVTGFQDALRARPVAVFAVSYMHGRARPMWRRAIEKSVKAAAEIAGAGITGIFGGRIESELPGFARFLFGLPNGLPADARDWDAIRAWARQLPEKMGVRK